ncbi:phospholipase D-like domain-containing protein [Blautia sp.]|uniref:phospholipase D-like domain-containing protein n=1 Tax=Blautia sp. TaxID=1955243 RepID=UPI003522E852
MTVERITVKGGDNMKKEFLTADAKFVYSKNELGYQEVLDNFENASEITIITYNISEKKNALVSALRKVKKHCVVNVITNIPSRWEAYYGDTFRNKAKQKINLYLSKLRPESLGINSKVFFDFSNHGKIVMTDCIVYVGSVNYSEESANNTEFGFISRDKDFINYINSEVLPDVQASAIPYYEYDYTALLLEASMALSVVYNIKNELYEEVYRLHDDVDGEWYYYVEHEASLTVATLDKVVQIVSESCKVASDIYDAIDTITNGDEDEIIAANDVYVELLALYSKIEEVRSFDTLIELSEFDSEEYINQQLQEEYAMEAYEDNLENCIEMASDEAMSIVWDLTQGAKGDIDELIEEVQKFCEIYSSLIENLRAREIKKISPKIDNT